MSKNKILKKMKSIIITIVITILLMILWDIIHYKLNINSVILPSFHEMIKIAIENFWTILYNSFYTIFETLLGLFLTFILSFSLVIIVNENTILKKFFLKFIYIFQMIPLIAIAPLIILWLGIGIWAKVFLIIIYSSFSIIVVTLEAFENVSTTHKLYIMSLSKSKVKLYRYLYFPMSISQIFSGIKIAVTYSVICAITGEYISAKYGLGILLNQAYGSYQTDLLFVIIVVIVVITMTLLKITNIVEKNIRS